ncbi:crotonase/enoyl-CoA hydratase family protein [Colwellia psychrerythraea]|uniref:Enoyl-CoA hydratase/isomerase n=1 Tax=Colwellia psychrerythraea TaxID=28229 RepID=A0A099KWT4_COLPS|nr:crotonase/enoyl-CoA hydratase family protein [Colwellia psychrerythraea]KGJ95056.1 Enoyl-CoA hydratase/isomerase [Colwellia psychrerythraea]
MINEKTDECINLRIENNIAYVSLNRAEKHNALDMTMFYAIRETINNLKRDRSIRAVIVEGKGEGFCSGLDIKAVMKSAKAPLKLLFKWLPWQANLAQYVSVGWRRIPAPVIMVIHGRCWGGGLQIALGGDFRIASPDASIAVMEARWGLIPDMGGTLALRELLSLDVAKELAMTGESINGEQALNFGLVTHVDDNPSEKALQLAQLICQQSPDSVAATKKLYNKSWWSKPSFALARESYYQIKILLGQNRKIKTYNQLHQDEKSKEFTKRQNW